MLHVSCCTFVLLLLCLKQLTVCHARVFSRGFVDYDCEQGGPLQKCKTPDPPKCSRECSGRCRPETGCSGKCLEKCLPLVSLLGKRRTSTFPSTSPSTPFLAGTSLSTLPSTFGGLGVLRFCRGPPRSQDYEGSAILCGLQEGSVVLIEPRDIVAMQQKRIKSLRYLCCFPMEPFMKTNPCTLALSTGNSLINLVRRCFLD